MADGQGSRQGSRSFGTAVRLEHDRVVVTLSGELDIASRDAVVQACTAIAGARVHVELDDVSFMDTSGHLAFRWARERLESAGGSLQVHGARGQPARLITLLDELAASGA